MEEWTRKTLSKNDQISADRAVGLAQKIRKDNGSSFVPDVANKKAIQQSIVEAEGIAGSSGALFTGPVARMGETATVVSINERGNPHWDARPGFRRVYVLQDNQPARLVASVEIPSDEPPRSTETEGRGSNWKLPTALLGVLVISLCISYAAVAKYLNTGSLQAPTAELSAAKITPVKLPTLPPPTQAPKSTSVPTAVATQPPLDMIDVRYVCPDGKTRSIATIPHGGQRVITATSFGPADSVDAATKCLKEFLDRRDIKNPRNATKVDYMTSWFVKIPID